MAAAPFPLCEELNPSLGPVGLAAPGSPVPSTPPRRNRASAYSRDSSAEKLPSPKRFMRPAAAALEGSLRLPPFPLGGGSAQSSPREVDDPIIDVDQMRSRADGDAKYWAQITYAHQLLMDSTATELALSEVAASNRVLLEPIFQEAIAGQSLDRLSAVAMLRVLRQLVSEADSELAEYRSLSIRSPMPTASSPAFAVSPFKKKAKCSSPSPSTPPRRRAPAAPSTPPSRAALAAAFAAPCTPEAAVAPGTPPSAGVAAPGTPERALGLLGTPQRRGAAADMIDRTPHKVRRPSRTQQPCSEATDMSDTCGNV